MKAIPMKNTQGMRLEYNPNNTKDVRLAVEIARYWHCRGAIDNQLIPVTPEPGSLAHLLKHAA